MMKKVFSVLAGCVLAGLVTPALGSNFSYTYVGGDLGVTTLDDDLIFNGEIYEEFGAANINGAFQFNENFAVRLSSSAISNDGPRTQITQTATNASVIFPFAVGSKLDIIPSLGYVFTESEFCDERWDYDGWYYDDDDDDFFDFYDDDECSSDDDSGVLFGISSRIWAIPGRLEFNAGVSDSNIEGSESTISLGGAVWLADHHSIRVNYGTNDTSSTVAVGYAFAW